MIPIKIKTLSQIELLYRNRENPKKLIQPEIIIK